MTEDRPILFLDVDGVLNCFNAGYEIVQPDPEGMFATVPPGSRRRIARLLAVYDIVWATAWMGMAHPHFREHLALPDSLPYVQWAETKLPAIVKYAGLRKWAFVDDDAEWELRKLGKAWGEIPGSLILVPDPKIGLTDEHVEQLLAFAAA